MTRETTMEHAVRPGNLAAGLIGVALGLLSGALLSRTRLIRSAADRASSGIRSRPEPVDCTARRLSPVVLTAATPSAASRDATPSFASGGIIAHPRQPLMVFDRPAGTAVGRLETTLLGGHAWLPVIAKQPGWMQLLLPARPGGPAGPTGWVAAGGVTLALSRHEIRVLAATGRAQLIVAGRVTRAWPASCGTPHAPTPPGLTFVLAVTRDTRRHPDPIVLPLAIPSRHAGCGASGVIAIHTAPPHPGCITVPPAALPALARAPLGSLVRIYP